jgi:hypothetical protein
VNSYCFTHTDWRESFFSIQNIILISEDEFGYGWFVNTASMKFTATSDITERFMVVSWWFHGRFMVVSWWFHGCFMVDSHVWFWCRTYPYFSLPLLCHFFICCFNVHYSSPERSRRTENIGRLPSRNNINNNAYILLGILVRREERVVVGFQHPPLTLS